MANATDHRQGRGRNRAHDPLIVEGPEVFQRAAAAHQQQHIDLGALVRGAQRLHQGRRRVCALYRAGVDDDLDMWGPARQRGQHVMQGRTGAGRDDADAARVAGQGALGVLVEQALGGQSRPQLQEQLIQGTGAGPPHRLDDELQFAARLIHSDPAAQLDQGTVCRREIEHRRGASKHRAAQAGRQAIGILEREVAVAARRTGVAGDFPAHRNDREALREALRDRLHEARHTPDTTAGRGFAVHNHAQTQCRRGLGSPQPHQHWLRGRFRATRAVTPPS
mmetsp:Transcript_1418/g.4232  ORF Transcript_1418/g.4232 Transcript_1418/m.4232 type:complete len:279 (-) Transcript_1418:340-1176(-)